MAQSLLTLVRKDRGPKKPNWTCRSILGPKWQPRTEVTTSYFIICTVCKICYAVSKLHMRNLQISNLIVSLTLTLNQTPILLLAKSCSTFCKLHWLPNYVQHFYQYFASYGVVQNALQMCCICCAVWLLCITVEVLEMICHWLCTLHFGH